MTLRRGDNYIDSHRLKRKPAGIHVVVYTIRVSCRITDHRAFARHANKIPSGPLHSHAVYFGMDFCTLLSTQQGLITPQERERIHEPIESFDLSLYHDEKKARAVLGLRQLA